MKSSYDIAQKSPSKQQGLVCNGLFSALALTSALMTPCHAAENGVITYANGVNTVLNGMVPERGATRFYSYTQYYEANKFAGANGESAIPSFHLKAFVEAPRVVHTWDTMLGGLTVSTGLIVPLVHLSLGAGGASGVKNNLGDITLETLLLGYTNQSHTFFAYAAPLDVVMPTGSYSKTSVANTGSNYFAWEPSIYTTWFPSPKWEISTMSMIEVNARNNATNYKSGSDFIFDYVIGYSVTPKLQLGVQGFYLKQFTDDKVDGVKFQDGFRAQAIGLGPQLRYDFKPGSAIVLKYQKEFSVRNRPEGNKFWIQLSVPL